MPHWQRGALVGGGLAILLLIGLAIYAAITFEIFCFKYVAYYQCLPWWKFIIQLFAADAVQLIFAILIPMTVLGIILQTVFSRLLRRK
jgi:hypothetical protein